MNNYDETRGMLRVIEAQGRALEVALREVHNACMLTEKSDKLLRQSLIDLVNWNQRLLDVRGWNQSSFEDKNE